MICVRLLRYGRLYGCWMNSGVGAGNRISWLSELLQQCSGQWERWLMS